MSATELLEQVKALPPAEQRKFFDRVQRLEEKLSAATPKRKSRPVRWPDGQARRAKIFGKKVLPNIVLMAREEERY
jgi:hypothetical protein